ncbi:hypothetical protein [Thalassotalea crassostreae]|uniref:hypothetical protein n=1 Tax=Thalassotalea crassostreae TaxID=1763536 RepID=UPI000837B1FF|nr:hypothetical protein [Thalassotalea crassostreae]
MSQLAIGNIDIKESVEEFFKAHDNPYVEFIIDDKVDFEAIQGIFKFISDEAVLKYTPNVKKIFKASQYDYVNSQNLLDSELYMELAEQDLVNDSFDMKLQDSKLKITELKSFIEQYSSKLDESYIAEIQELLDGCDRALALIPKKVVISCIAGLILTQMGINDGRKQTKLIWGVSCSDEEDPVHALNYGKEFTLKSAMKSGLGIRYDCNCQIKFIKTSDENIIVLKTLDSLVPKAVEKNKSKQMANKVSTSKSSNTIVIIAGLLICVALIMVLLKNS